MIALLLTGAALALTCEGYSAPEVIAAVDGGADESSGLAYSRTRPGVWFTHDDSGGGAVVFAFDLTGTHLGAHAVEGAVAADWEDMAAGPCPGGGGDCLFLGDIGDNFHVREFVTVYAVPEPRGGRDGQVLAAWTLRYPDGEARDSEALLVHPRTGRVYLVTKEDAESCGVYALPAEPTDDGELALVATLSLPGSGGARTVTSADWDPDGDRVVVRTYTTAFEWAADPCDPDAVWAGEPSAWATADGQGEAIAFDLDGDLITTSEGSPMVLQRLACGAAGEGGGPCDSGLGDSGGGDAYFGNDGGGCGCGAGGVRAWWSIALLLPLLWRRGSRALGSVASRRGAAPGSPRP